MNQKLINYFIKTTIQHPNFQQLHLPFSFNQTLIKLGLTNDEHVSPKDDEQTPHPITTDKDNDPHDDDDDADQRDGDILRTNTHDDHHHNHKNSSKHDDHDDYDGLDTNHDHDDNSQDGHNGGNVLTANSLNLHPPLTLPNKSSLTQLVTQSAPTILQSCSLSDNSQTKYIKPVMKSLKCRKLNIGKAHFPTNRLICHNYRLSSPLFSIQNRLVDYLILSKTKSLPNNKPIPLTLWQIC